MSCPTKQCCQQLLSAHDELVKVSIPLLQDIIDRALAVIFSDRFVLILSHFTDLGTAEENEKIL